MLDVIKAALTSLCCCWKNFFSFAVPLWQSETVKQLQVIGFVGFVQKIEKKKNARTAIYCSVAIIQSVSLKREGFGFKSRPGRSFSLWSLYGFSTSLMVSFGYSVIKQATCSACWQRSNRVSNKREGINCHAVSSQILPHSAAAVCIFSESRTPAVHRSRYKHYTWFRARLYKKQRKMMILFYRLWVCLVWCWRDILGQPDSSKRSREHFVSKLL